MRSTTAFATIMALITLIAPAAIADDFRTASPDGAAVYFITPADGEVIDGPVVVKFGLKGMGVAPAFVEKENTGHHHIILNAELPPEDENIPADENHIHFGGGQTETVLDLPAGTHTLQLLLGDMNHIPHKPVIASKRITITVK